MDSPLFNEREKAAILWAEHVTKNTAKFRDDVFEKVKKAFNESEIVELTFMIGYFNLRNRFQDSLKIPLEPHSGEKKLKDRSVWADTESLRKYLQFVLDNWPETFPDPTPDD
ncbi:MAG: hypothetical protein RIB59_17405 [Rhodospirillales bacterium]